MVCIIMVYIIILFTPHSPHQELSHTESLPPQKSTFCSPTCMDSPPGHNSSLCSVIDPSGWILIGVPLGTRRALFLEFYRAASELRTVSQLHAGSLSVRANSHRLEKEICTVPQVLNPTAKKREFFFFPSNLLGGKKKKKGIVHESLLSAPKVSEEMNQEHQSLSVCQFPDHPLLTPSVLTPNNITIPQLLLSVTTPQPQIPPLCFPGVLR